MKSKIFGLLFTIFLALTVLLFINITYDYLYPIKHEILINEYCQIFNVETELVFAVINAESSFNENVVSSAGAVGLMQILPSTADYIAKKLNYKEQINLFEIECNLFLGIAYLSYLKNCFTKIDEVISAYNAGEGVVREWIENSKDGDLEIQYPETRAYLKKVKQGMEIYAKKLS